MPASGRASDIVEVPAPAKQPALVRTLALKQWPVVTKGPDFKKVDPPMRTTQ